MAGRKSTKAELKYRIDKVNDLLIQGYTRNKIWSLIENAEQDDPLNWGISLETLDRYIVEVREEWVKLAAQDKPLNFAKAIARREELYQQAYEYKDLKTALAIEIDLAKMLDLYPTVKTEVTVTTENPYDKLSAEELKELYEKRNKE